MSNATASAAASASTPHTEPTVAPQPGIHTVHTIHTLNASCRCQPATAWDGHRNDDGSPVEFEAMAGDPIDADGYPLEVTR